MNMEHSGIGADAVSYTCTYNHVGGEIKGSNELCIMEGKQSLFDSVHLVMHVQIGTGWIDQFDQSNKG